ncbi:MAG TPA: amidohydrolase [Firmicutes bacterium]|nr:amidohydrolase [Bacillota bacterium]
MSDIDKYQALTNGYIDKNKDTYVRMSEAIHKKPELGNQEVFACELLTSYLIQEDFVVNKHIAGHETGFIATKKSNISGPVIGLLAEYDALKGLGHACGHNLIGLMSVSAGVALSKVVEEIGGTIVIFGCPAEEGGENGNAKESYVKANLFQDVDVTMMIHPFDQTAITAPTLAIKKFKVKFHGKPAHAASAPEKGVNALDAMILFYNAINALRQHVQHDVLIHGIITHGGDAPNIVPHFTEASFYLRSNFSKRCDEVFEKVVHIGEGAAIATGCTFEYDDHYNRVKELLRCPSFDELYVVEAKKQGLDVLTENMRSVGSTDTGNVSLVVPTIHPTIKICQEGISIHTHEFEKAAGSISGFEAMIIGGKILASIGVDLLLDHAKLDDIKKEFETVKSKHMLEQNL